ncbi:MAG: hypothetical protein KH009_07190 [Clostridiales bacterium]|nr:hypothetical protein [Clostridiales bacterium]
MTRNSETVQQDFIGYEYKEVTAHRSRIAFYLDSYQSFGWQVDQNLPQQQTGQRITITLKRNRHIINKAELTRLQRNFEACVRDIGALEHSKGSGASVLALAVGLAGTAFMACSVFAVTAAPPHIPACIAFAVPAFAGWIAAPLLYRWRLHQKERQVAPLIEEKYEEIYHLCERGHQLIPQS